MAPEPSRVVFGLEEKIGSGGFSHVFKGTNKSTGTICAIKKSRASLKLKRPILVHEARILKRLQGHPSIPELYGYGRFEHFEFLAMELLGKTLTNQDKVAQGYITLQEIADIGVQLLSALEHIHSHGIVHRDLKPENILARRGSDFSHVYIIDFGLARRRLSGPPRQIDLVKESINVIGTLSWASLNAYNGIDLNPRDDLESLAFILLYLLRGNLPWHKLCTVGTSVGRIPQIRSKQLAWSGARLAEGYPSAFGQLLDYARRLGFEESIDYERFRANFKKLRHSAIEIKHKVDPDPKPSSIVENVPVTTGDLVLVQIDIRTSVEGGDAFRENNSSYVPDQSLSGDYWKVPFRPAIAMGPRQVKKGERTESIWLMPLTATKLANPGDAISLAELGVDNLPIWGPLTSSNLSAYVFPHALAVLPVSSQAPVCSRWSVPRSGRDKLWAKFNTIGIPFDPRQTKDKNPDVRHGMRLRMQEDVFYAKILPLDLYPDTQVDIDVDWTGTRGWFDECVKVGKQRGWEDGYFWTGHPSDKGACGVELDDSYYSEDLTWWHFRQQERDEELEIDGGDGAVHLPLIDEVVGTGWPW